MKVTRIEKEKYTEDEFMEYLNDDYGEVSICGMNYLAGYVLKLIDETAFNTMMADCQEYESAWNCGECGTEHDNEGDAEDCCNDVDGTAIAESPVGGSDVT